MSEIDIADDDALRFAQRVLESNAPAEDRKAARDMIVAIRTRILKERAVPVRMKFGKRASPEYEAGWKAGFDAAKAHGLHGSPARQGAEPDGQDLNPDLSASASPATKEQQ